MKFRKLVNEHKMRYLACSKIEKPHVAREVVALWRKMDPPGRFLSRLEGSKENEAENNRNNNTAKKNNKSDNKTKNGKKTTVDTKKDPLSGLWYEVSDKKAREKGMY